MTRESDSHHTLDDRLRDRILLFVLEELEAEERQELEEHFVSCAPCRAERDASLEAFGTIGGIFAAPPPPELKTRLLARVRAARAEEACIAESETEKSGQVWKHWQGEAGTPVRLLRGADARWEETGFPGIRARRLHADPQRGGVTMMIQMDSGARYPRHRHGGVEECFVLEGDLRHGSQVMHAGDFEVAESGSLHDVQWTEGGCLLLIRSSCVDELLEG